MLGPYVLITISSCWIIPFIIIYYSSFYLVMFFGLEYIFSGRSTATPAFFWLPFASSIIFHPCTLNLCLSLEIRWIFWRQSIFGPYYFFNPISHCVSFAELNSFALRVIIDKWGVSTAIFCFVVALYLYCFFFPLGFCLLSLDFCDLKKNPSFFHISCPCSRLFFHSYCEMCINVC